MAQEIDYYCLNCGQKLDKNKIEKHMEGHKREAREQVTGRIRYTRQLQDH